MTGAPEPPDGRNDDGPDSREPDGRKLDGEGLDDDTLADARRAQDGSATAWQRLNERVVQFASQTAGRLGLPPTMDADDLVQDVLVRMLHSLPTFEIRSRPEFWSWVKTLCHHAATDAARRFEARGGRRVGSLDTDSRPQRHEIDDGQPSVGAFARLDELAEVESTCVSRLPREESRTVYTLRRVEELDYEQIAARVGRDRGDAVRLVYKRARDRVKSCMLERLSGYETILERLGDDE